MLLNLQEMHFAFKLAHEWVYYHTEILVPTCANKLALLYANILLHELESA